MLRKSFTTIQFKRIFRENNTLADRLSKKGLYRAFGHMYCELTHSVGEGAKGMVCFS